MQKLSHSQSKFEKVSSIVDKYLTDKLNKKFWFNQADREAIKQHILTAGIPPETPPDQPAAIPQQSKMGLMFPQGNILRHPFSSTLKEYAFQGCPVDCGENWTREQVEQAVMDGPNDSARDPVAAKCCRDEAFEKVDQGFVAF